MSWAACSSITIVVYCGWKTIFFLTTECWHFGIQSRSSAAKFLEWKMHCHFCDPQILRFTLAICFPEGLSTPSTKPAGTSCIGGRRNTDNSRALFPCWPVQKQWQLCHVSKMLQCIFEVNHLVYYNNVSVICFIVECCLRKVGRQVFYLFPSVYIFSLCFSLFLLPFFFSPSSFCTSLPLLHFPSLPFLHIRVHFTLSVLFL